MNAGADRSPREREIDRKLARVELSDSGNAERLIARHGDDLWFVPGLGWHVWDGKRWRRDNGYHAAVALVRAMTMDIQHEARALKDDEVAAEMIEARVLNGLSPDRDQASKDYGEYIKKLAGWRGASGNAARIKSALEMAEHQKLKDQAEFDQRGNVVPVQNGTLRFQDGGLELTRGHRRDDLFTAVLPADYDADAACPEWLSFLESAQPDPEMRAFLQRLAGYALIGANCEQVFIWHKGAPAAGKGTFLGVLKALFADFAVAISFDLLAHQRNRNGEGATPSLARLPGRRLVIATEPETNVRLSEGLIKSLTGGEVMSARKLNQDVIEFECKALFMTPMNNPPFVSEDRGIWRRLLLIDWANETPAEKRDAHLRGRIIANELAGVLAWAVRGAVDWRERGLAPPKAVKAATSSLRAESDPIAEFADLALRFGDPHDRTPVPDIRAAYQAWCEVQGIKPVSDNRLGRWLSERGTKTITPKNVRIRTGVALIRTAADVRAGLDPYGSSRPF